MSFLKTIRGVFLALIAAAVICSFSFAYFEPQVVYAAGDTPQELAAQAEQQQANDSGFSIGACASQGFGCITYIIVSISIFTLQFALFVLSLVGVFLDLSLLLSFNMGAILNQSTTLGTVVAQSWGIFRDLANLMFIAGFIWVSIAMILQVSVPGGNNGKFIANIIIAALLVNFSYFFAGAIIDASNTLSWLIYKQGVLNGEDVVTVGATAKNGVDTLDNMIKQVLGNDHSHVASATVNGTTAVANATVGQIPVIGDASRAAFGFIGGQFMYQTNLVSILDPTSLSIIAKARSDTGLATLIIAGLFLVGATIELFAGMLFVILGRFIILLILLILSPLLVFRLMGIQPFAAWGDHWWKTLMSQVIFFPVFIFMTAISFRIIAGFRATLHTSQVTFTQLLATPSGSEFESALALVVLFAIAFGLLKYSKTTAQNLASGKQVDLPNIGKIQEVLSGVGNKTGVFARKTAMFPGMAARTMGIGWPLRGIGAGLREVGNIEGVKQFGESAGDAWRSRPRLLGGDRLLVEREQRARKDLKKEVGEINGRIAELERDRANASATDKITIDDAIKAQKDKRKALFEKTFDTLGAQKMAKQISGIEDPRLRRDTAAQALDALDDERARSLANALAGAGVTRTKASAFAQEQAAKDGAGAEALLAELKGLRRDQKIEAMRERKRDTAELTATTEGLSKLRSDIGHGALGYLPVNELVKETTVTELDANDLAAIEGRKDISSEEKKRIREAVKSLKPDVAERHSTSPSAIEWEGGDGDGG